MSERVFSFAEDGFFDAGPVYDASRCASLSAEVRQLRTMDNLFLTESDYRADPRRFGVSPRAGRNLLGRLDCAFVFENEIFTAHMRRILGDRFRVLDHKLVMSVPDGWLPGWVREETTGHAAVNLGPYVNLRYRDVTYFHGIDFHQDLIDFRDRPADFITAYIYLEETTADMSPLHVIPGSHRFGATVFPHKLEKISNGKLRYTGDDGRSGEFDTLALMGPAGSLYCWHAMTLHGTQQQLDPDPRISIRLLIEKNRRSDSDCELDIANRSVAGRLSLEDTRIDIDAHGNVVTRGNVVNELKI